MQVLAHMHACAHTHSDIQMCISTHTQYIVSPILKSSDSKYQAKETVYVIKLEILKPVVFPTGTVRTTAGRRYKLAINLKRVELT